MPTRVMDSDFTNEEAWIEAGTMRREHPAPGLFGPLPVTKRRFTVDWIAGREANQHGDPASPAGQPPDPAWPDGCAIDVALDAPQACRVELPWPAERHGMWVVTCLKCGFAIALATAGRTDDPRSVRVPCKLR